MAGVNCLIEASDTCFTDYYTLGLWGKPVIWYPIQAALESGMFDRVIINSCNPYIKYLVKEYFDERIVFGQANNSIAIDGRAALLTPEGIRRAVQKAYPNKSKELLKCVEEEQAVIVRNELSFELALSMLHKRNRKNWLRCDVLNRISEKTSILKTVQAKSICFVGHSQLDQWSISDLCGYTVRNCGINGITAREYIDDILKKGLFSFQDEAYLVLLGVNELVLPISIQDIVEAINDLIIHILGHSNAPIFFVEPLYVNGRLDRNNTQINMLRYGLKQSKLSTVVHWIETDSMNDAYGHLDYKYTTDGLHLNTVGYEIFQKTVIASISDWKEKSL